jgi:siroheme synthase-like protein
VATPDPQVAAGVSVELQVAGRRVLVVGGGPVGARRARSLAQAGARVVVVTLQRSAALESLVDDGGLPRGASITVLDRAFAESDLDPTDGESVWLVVAASDRRELNERVAELARARGVLVNRADDGAAGDVAFSAVRRRGPLQVAVSTGGTSPTVTRWAAQRLDDRLDEVLGLDADGLALLVELVQEVREELARPDTAGSAASRALGGGTRTEPVDWRSALDGSILELIHRGRRAEAKERLLACLSS